MLKLTFMYTDFESISSLVDGEPRYGQPFELKDNRWQIVIRSQCSERTKFRRYLGIYLRLESGRYIDFFTSTLMFTLELCNTKGKRLAQNCKFEYDRPIARGNCTFIAWDKLMDPNNGFVNNNRIRVCCDPEHVELTPAHLFNYSENEHSFAVDPVYLSNDIYRAKEPIRQRYQISLIGRDFMSGESCDYKRSNKLKTRKWCKEGIEYLEITFNICPPHCNFDSITEGKFELRIVDENRRTLLKKARDFREDAGKMIVWNEIIEWNEMINPKNGYIQDGWVFLELHTLEIDWLADFDFKKPSENRQHAIVARDRYLYIHEELFSRHSLMFQATCKDIPIVLSFDPDEIECLFAVIHRFQPIDLRIVHSILQLARYFQMPFLKNDCIRFLVETESLSKQQKMDYFRRINFPAAQKLLNNPNVLKYTSFYKLDLGEPRDMDHVKKRKEGLEYFLRNL